MTPKQKQLLLKDLCGRMLFEPMCEYTDVEDGCRVTAKLGYSLRDFITGKVLIKPYLRPLSSMTEEEFEYLKSYSGLIYDQLELPEFPNNSKCLEFYLSEIPSYVVILVFDWLNERHFDYRGLITMGLALPAPQDMYNITVK